MNHFENKVALISGGSRGIGYALAVRLVRGGAKVIITARGNTRLQASKEELVKMGGEVLAVPGDVGSREDAGRMVASAIDQFGRLDMLINNAGVSMRGNFADLNPEVCARVIETNLMGSVHLSRAAVDHLVAARGNLIFVSSIAGLFGLPGASVYCASKKALTGLAESLRLELIPRGVHVGIAYLGFTEHDPEKRILAADGRLVPSGRPAHHTQDEAARLIVRMIRRRKRELIMTPIGNLGWLAYRLWPGLVERAVLWAGERRLAIFKRFS